MKHYKLASVSKMSFIPEIMDTMDIMQHILMIFKLTGLSFILIKKIIKIFKNLNSL